MLVRNARRSALLEPLRAPPIVTGGANDAQDDVNGDELRDAVAPLSNEPLDAENDSPEDSDPAAAAPHAPRAKQRRSTSEFNRSIGLMLSASYLTATYGGAPAVYSLWLGEQCTSTVVVHLQTAGDAPAAAAASKDASVRLSCDRLEFTPRNYGEPQIVRVELVEPCGGTHLVLHRVFSLDKNYDRLVAPNVVIKTERSSVGSLLLLGGALVHKRKNAKGEIMAPRLAANRTIDIGRALVAAATTAAAAATTTPEADGDDFVSLSFSAAPHTQQPLESSPVFVSHMAAGHSFSSLVVKPQGGVETLLVWGMNGSGELGIGSTTPMVDPVPLVLPPQPQLLGEPMSVVSMACGKHHAALVTTHGRLFTWGNNKHGQLGLGDYTNVDSPREVVFAGALFRAAASQQRALRLKHAMLDHGNTNVTQVACGSFHTLFVTHQQHVLSMGYNQAGQLGLGHRLQQLKGWRSCTPAMVETLRDSCILDIAAGQNHSACVLSNGDVYVWGCGGDGRLGVPLGQAATGEVASRQSQSECEVLPVPVVSLKDICVKARSVRCGARHTAIISDRDLLYVWGANEFGQLGLGDKRTRARPCLVQFPPFLNEGVVDVSLGEFHSACVTWSGEAYVWGLDLTGEQSARLDQRCSPELVHLPGTESAIRVACGWAHTTVLTQASRDGGENTRDGSDTMATGTGTRKTPVHVHRRKEKALQYATRQQEVAKWRRVTTAVSLMGRLQRRVSVWKQNKAKKSKNGGDQPKKMSLAQVVKNALHCSKRNILQEQERERRERITAIAQPFVLTVIGEAVKRAGMIVTEQRAKKRERKKRRPASSPVRHVKAVPPSSPHGVFYHNALQFLSPPTIPPPCLMPPASSPRHVIINTAGSYPTDDDCPWSPTPTPPASRSRASRPVSATPSPRSIRSPRNHQLASPQTATKLSLTPSCESLLSALHEESVRDESEEEVRPPTLSAPSRSKRLDAVEHLLYKPSFSLASRLANGGVRGSRPVQPRHPCR